MTHRDTALVVGSLHHDIMVDAPHLPQLGETVTGFRWYPKFGGKGGNQAAAAKRHGAGVRLIGAIGEDAFGQHLLSILQNLDIDISDLQTLSDQPTGMSVAVSNSDGDYGAVIVSGANQFIDKALLLKESVWTQVGILLLQNEVPEALNIAAATEARRRGITVCLNAAPARELDQQLLSLVDILVVNAIEAKMLSSIPTDTRDGAHAAAHSLAHHSDTVILTLGGDGVIVERQFESRPAQSVYIPALKVEVKSTHGAGDAFIGALSAAMLARHDILSAVTFANSAAGQHVSQGAMPTLPSPYVEPE